MMLLFILATTAAPKQTAREQAMKEKQRIAVLDLTGSAGLSADVLASLSAMLAQGIDELGPFKSVTSSDIRQLVSMEETKAIVGCSSSECMAEIADALGTRYVVSGTVLAADKSFIVQVQLLNSRIGRAEQRVMREHKGELGGLFDEIRIAAKLLLRPLLDLSSGKLTLTVSEPGSTIRLDGSIIGMSPLPPQSVAGGVHTVRVEKEGFITQSLDVEVKPKLETMQTLQLIPSDEYREKYRAGAMRVRYAGIGVGIFGALAGGASVALFVHGAAQASVLSRDINAYNGELARTPTADAALTERRGNLGLVDGFAVATLAVSVAAIATAVGLIVGGDDPTRFDKLTVRF